MSRWPMVALGEIAPLLRRPVALGENGRYREIGARSFGKGLFIKPEFDAETATWQKPVWVKAGDLVFSNIKAWEGAIAVALAEHNGTIASHRYLTCVPDPEKAVPGYLCYYLLTPQGLEAVGHASPGTADRNRTTSPLKLQAIKVPLPPLPEQQAIVTRLDALADKSKRLATHWQAIERDADALLSSLAHGRELSEDQKRTAGWRECSLADCLREASNIEIVKVDASYPNVGIYSYARGVFGKPNIEGATTSATALNRIKAGYFIYSRLFAFEGAYAVVPPEFDGYYVSAEFPTFELASGIKSEFLYAYFRDPRVWEQIATGSKGLGNRRQRVQVPQLLSHRLWVPPPAWQQRIADLLPSIMAIKTNQRVQREAILQLSQRTLEEIFG